MAAQTNWWSRLLAAACREYERRIRAASLVTEYGAQHSHPAANLEDAEAAEIINLPRGARLRRADTSPPKPEHP